MFRRHVYSARRSSLAAAAVAAGLAAASVPSPASAGLAIVSQSVQLDQDCRTARFDLTFNRTPDFYHADQYGRPADSFQCEINPNWQGDPKDLQLGFGQFTRVVRGDEIRFCGDGHPLAVRDATTPQKPDPHSGGWGPVVVMVPLHQQGNSVSFVVPMSAMGGGRGGSQGGSRGGPTGLFSYDVFTTNFGATVSEVRGFAAPTPQPVPLPPAAFAGMVTLGGLGLYRLLRSARCRLEPEGRTLGKNQ